MFWLSFLDFPILKQFYISIALTFSSTIIILKLLSDKGDLNKLYGRIAIGFLLVQDLIATVILVIISSSANLGSEGSLISELAYVLFMGLLTLVSLMIISTKLLKKLNRFVGSSQEYLFIFGLSWGLAIASLYHLLGLSIEIGALVAGVTLSMSPFALELSSKLKPLRDFFIILFFILLGYNMSFDNWQMLALPTLLFSIFILIGNPLIVFILMKKLGHTRKNGFLSGLVVAQISEFSLILVTLGYNVGHLSKEIVSMVTMIGIITIAGSTYLILYADPIYKRIIFLLKYFEFGKPKRTKKKEIVTNFDAIIFGYRRAGPEFAQTFDEKKYSYLVVDFDPSVIELLENKGIPCEYGDMDDTEFLDELPLKNAKMIVSTVSELEPNLLLLRKLRKINKKAVAIVISDSLNHTLTLYESGATHVVLSHYIGAHHAANMVLQKGMILKDMKDYETGI